MGYRLYFLSRTGRVERGVELSSEDDAAAIRTAWTHASGAAMELWQAERMVKAYPATDPRMAPQNTSALARPGPAKWTA